MEAKLWISRLRALMFQCNYSVVVLDHGLSLAQEAQLSPRDRAMRRVS